MLNHSRVSPNCVPKVVEFQNSLRLIFLAKEDIIAGTELLYDYGDRSVHIYLFIEIFKIPLILFRSKESLEAFPWLST